MFLISSLAQSKSIINVIIIVIKRQLSEDIEACKQKPQQTKRPWVGRAPHSRAGRPGSAPMGEGEDLPPCSPHPCHLPSLLPESGSCHLILGPQWSPGLLQPSPCQSILPGATRRHFLWPSCKPSENTLTTVLARSCLDSLAWPLPSMTWQGPPSPVSPAPIAHGWV